jgi:hypothetical protein
VTDVEEHSEFRLELPAEPIVVRVGQRPDVRAIVRNISDEPRQFLGGTPIVGFLFDLATGEPLPAPSVISIAGMGVEALLRPGKTVELGVVLSSDDTHHLDAGEYGISVTLSEGGLVLRAVPGRLVVTRNRFDPRIRQGR